MLEKDDEMRSKTGSEAQGLKSGPGRGDPGPPDFQCGGINGGKPEGLSQPCDPGGVGGFSVTS